MKTIYTFDQATGFYTGQSELGPDDLSPLEPGVYLIPAGVVEIEPPAAPNGQAAQWIGAAWQLVTLPTPEVVPNPAPPTPEQLIDSLTAAIQQRLDGFARTRKYDSMLSACTYTTSTMPKFKAEAQACVNLRDATWAAAYALLDKVQAGTRAMPASITDIEADLPALVWPA
jgi:hypothetical protein